MAFKMKDAFKLFVFFTIFPKTAFEQSITTNSSVDSSFYIYILMGQSNMTGRGKLTDAYKAASNSRVMMLNKSNEWVVAKQVAAL